MGNTPGRVSLADRKQCVALVQEAVSSGASRAASCDILNLDLRRLQRWEEKPDQGDERKGPKNTVPHSLTSQEKEMILEVSNSTRFRDKSPWYIVATLADEGNYLASESSFYRILNENKLLSHRSKNSPRTHSKPWHLVAKNPNEIWSWDITYLKSPIKGIYYYLYLIEDIFSRMIVGWRVEELESSDLAANLIEFACSVHKISPGQITLHSDNGSPMKGGTMLAKLQTLGVIPSFSRPSVSDDNPFSESLFKTLKYRPSFPEGAFANLKEASEWVRRFVQWYNDDHLHSGIKFVTPATRHHGKDLAILENREAVYQLAREANPRRWSKQTRNWDRIEEVNLNPKKERKNQQEVLEIQAA